MDCSAGCETEDRSINGYKRRGLEMKKTLNYILYYYIACQMYSL